MVKILSNPSVFEAGKSYLADYAGMVSGPYNSSGEALKDAVDSDLVLIAVSAKALKKRREDKVAKVIPIKKNITGITIDFTNKKLIVTGDEGAKAFINNVSYDIGEYELDDEELKEWHKIINSSFLICRSNTKVIGQPPVQGECLDALLHM